MPLSGKESEVLTLDANTLKDLEIFESETAENSLFKFCNLTRTGGGAKVLRRRMEHPWSSADRIRATQESLSFILTQRQAFEKQPPAQATRRVARYMREALPIVTQQNPLEFGLGAFTLRANQGRYYFSIAYGVQIACSLIRILRRFVDQAELASPPGELAPLFKEIRELLARPGLSRIPDQEIGGWAWKILRLDQVFSPA